MDARETAGHGINAMDDGGGGGGGAGSVHGGGSCAWSHNRKVFSRLPVEARRRSTKTESIQGAILEETELPGDHRQGVLFLGPMVSGFGGNRTTFHQLDHELQYPAENSLLLPPDWITARTVSSYRLRGPANSSWWSRTTWGVYLYRCMERVSATAFLQSALMLSVDREP